MIILQDFVHLHSKKTDRFFQIGRNFNRFDPNSANLELALIGIGALVLLVVTAILSIPDKGRQEELRNIDMGRKFAVEPCDMNLKRVDIGQHQSAVTILRPCIY